MQVISKQGQWLSDIVVREVGVFDEIFAIAVRNNISITDALEIGTSIDIPAIVDKRVVNYMARHHAAPATNIMIDVAMEGIEFWTIENDFIVS